MEPPAGTARLWPEAWALVPPRCVVRNRCPFPLCLPDMTKPGNKMTDTESGEVTPAAGFEDLGLDPRVLDALTALGYEEPPPLQREAIPPQPAGKDLLAPAATGTASPTASVL